MFMDPGVTYRDFFAKSAAARNEYPCLTIR